MKKNKIYIIILLLMLLPISIFSHSKSNLLNGITIVLDAGHGGMDKGASFENVDEDKINLEIVKKLKNKLEKLGCKIVLTRKNENDLSNESSNKKREDMKNRINIINDEKNDFLLSVHMNSYQKENVQGLHVFYKIDSESSKELATQIQNQSNQSLQQEKQIKQGNYYILNYSRIPSILIECGFLSNEVDRNNLVKDSYQNKIVDCIIRGMLTFYEERGLI